MPDLAKCPCCLEWVSAAHIVDHAQVQCPLCGARYLTHELLPMQPPELLVLPSSAPEGQTSSSGYAAAPLPAAEPRAVDGKTETTGWLPESSRPIAESSVLSPRVTEPTGSGEGVRVPSPFVAQPRSHTPSVAGKWRARRSGKRPLIELCKIVLGGLAGVVIAQLILWWLPGNLRRDPFGLAPRLPAWLHWLRPDELGVPQAAATVHHVADAPAVAQEDPFVDDTPVRSALRLPLNDPAGTPSEPTWRVAGLLDAPRYSGTELHERHAPDAGST